ncbi:major facilitator superfamily transporter [Colletotrichum scovillei]|uniref:major facilitator superfamily transporter n=1 Tax=Colletotrichum scovillei TaxID=1209932 RepID=UPI0015C30CB2|nr:major facilitator superfamily transporter [Colletotrichum scovillei]KAF4776362.1 major facilitator superfamily transporter [Colletotrichum scovillei]KAG7071678.1 major facilitator superfamily transporter [Colletotrichum scovillei]KAG7080017.1 major facilitator superfamily transporter [Colletotrichum scovillei]
MAHDTPAQTDGDGLPPGTTRLIDVDGSVISKHASGSDEADIVLIPRPSEDPEDPLNWTKKRKWLATSCVLVYTVMIAIPSSAVYSVVTPIRKATGLSLSDINNGTGIMFLFYGWGCLIWQPFALQYGKRPAYLASLIANIIILATAPMCTTKHTYLANRILLGLFGAPVESLCEISITDIWFAHQRPKYLALYGWGLSMTGKLAPMLSGFINVGMGWKWTLWWCSIFNGIALVYCFLFMEETNYDRPARSVENSTFTGHATGVQEQHNGSDADEKSSDKAGEKNMTNAKPVDSETGQVIYPRKTYIQKLGIKDKTRPNRMLDIALGGLRGFTYPSVVYAGLMYGANNLVWSGVQNATAGTVYTTMYGFSTAGVAAAYAGGLLGTMVGGYYCGKVGRLLTIRLARRNNGIAESEHSLWLFSASMFLVPFSMLLYGLGVTYHIHWMGLVISQFTLAINNALAVAGSLGYAIASYPQLSGDMITTCVIIRNTMSFAINYGITPWLNHMGYRDTYIIVAAIGFVWNASIFVMTKYGRTIREKSANRYWRHVAKAHAKGLSH